MKTCIKSMSIFTNHQQYLVPGTVSIFSTLSWLLVKVFENLKVDHILTMYLPVSTMD